MHISFFAAKKRHSVALAYHFQSVQFAHKMCTCCFNRHDKNRWIDWRQAGECACKKEIIEIEFRPKALTRMNHKRHNPATLLCEIFLAGHVCKSLTRDWVFRVSTLTTLRFTAIKSYEQRVQIFPFRKTIIPTLVSIYRLLCSRKMAFLYSLPK